VVTPERLELPACWFEASRSIQLSYGANCVFVWGERPGSNRRPSEPQSDALTN
jgi:hypothetical protein